METMVSYTEWLPADEMHEQSLAWRSELEFSKDEQEFLNILITENTKVLLDNHRFKEVQELVSRLTTLETSGMQLLAQLQKHENKLDVMTNSTNERALEKAYIAAHKELGKRMRDHRKNYALIKERLFMLIRGLMKDNKRLLPG
ncbi:hypothetical protein [Maribacter sp. 2307ULW6-5]|uniref:hypothetical protein n=1 Tax=Maribacter sp. 2307ULW6-5 TaxID=3386275 RepID=UPI0039BCCE01